MPPKIAFFTICSANYLSYALTLARSLSEAESNVKLHIFLADRLPAAVTVPDDHVVMTGIDELAIDDLDDMAFRYSILELNTAIKPYCFDYLFDALRYDAAIYLDPDILVLRPLDHVRTALEEGASCVLTPHITRGLSDGRQPDENTFLTCGVFNLGIAAFANVPESRSLIEWWGKKTRRDCIVATNRGIFTDQSYCNFAPCFIDRFHALRHPAYNVAYWNLSQREITGDGDRYFVDGEPVRFVHFSGIEPHNPTSFSKYQNRFTRRDIGALKKLADRYVAELDLRDQHGTGRFSEIPYAFGSFRDGRPLNELFRFIYRQHQDALSRRQDPFDLTPAFFNETSKDHPSFDGLRISRLYAAVWERRINLQRAFDLGTPKGQADFLNWAVGGLPRECGLGPPFILPTPTQSGAMLPAQKWRRSQREEMFDRAITSRSFMLRNLLRRQLLGKERVRDYWERRLSTSAAPLRQQHHLPQGLEVYGFFRAETGVGQAARGIVQAIRQAAVPFSCHTLSVDRFANDIAFDDVNGDAAYGAALICANADFVVDLEKHIEAGRLLGRHRLTHWAWELPVFPAAWAAAFDKVDEVWTGSRFVARSVAAATKKTVRVVPYVVQTSDMPASEARSKLKLPPDPFIFLTVLDVNSFPSRKNPIAVARAFQAAFPDTGEKSRLLIIKYHGRSKSSEFRKSLAQAVAGDPRILEIDMVYSAEQMSWLRAACDAFVSLHRSEGFGLNIAEAMAAGKLAIATHFSGNEDFMNRENSIPIPFKMTAVGKSEYP